MTEQQIVKLIKAGKEIVVRARNGDCIPMFHWKPAAYRCCIGKKSIPGAVVNRLINRRVIVCINDGWYTEGHFKFNADLRDERGRFRPRAKRAQGTQQ